STLYGIGYPNDSRLYTIDPSDGSSPANVTLKGDAATDKATTGPDLTVAPYAWNGLSPASNGNLLLGANTTEWIYELAPVTGITSHFAKFPTGIVSAGDFLTLPSGQILAIGIEFAAPSPYTSIFYLID